MYILVYIAIRTVKTNKPKLVKVKPITIPALYATEKAKLILFAA